MTERPQQSPQAGIADAFTELSEQTGLLVRQEIDNARREMWDKLLASAPALGLLAASGALGLLAAASSYRLSLRLLEKWLPPATAAFVATTVYGGGATCAVVEGLRRLREVPPPFPTETAREVGAIAQETAAQARNR